MKNENVAYMYMKTPKKQNYANGVDFIIKKTMTRRRIESNLLRNLAIYESSCQSGALALET